MTPCSDIGIELEKFIRDAASSYWHQTCTAKMGRDPRSVVDGRLKVYGIETFGSPTAPSCLE
jgi:choline dehydrogenase-like flavoprotein